ncbi:MAG: acyl-CoA dehydrogenase family protein [Deltaproteobacteria bacterium]|nr:MAG: acyl-CoA dehydrogenase family protein [Deltaproteobacteria bacterium]
MDLRYSAEYEAFRREVREFLANGWPLAGEEAGLPADQQAARFRERAIEKGYVARAIPRRYGGSEQPPDVLKAAILREEFRRARAPGELHGIGPSMFVPTLLEHGAEWQKERFIPPTIRGEMVWCQGYSEPGSGSDLASLRTRAELVGDAWVINGQKIWTTGAQRADFMFLLCRTEPDAPKHAGISYLLLDMKAPGIEVRPLRQLDGGADFNEVFLTDARTPADHIVGRRGEGWTVSRSTLKHERNMIGDATTSRLTFAGLVQLARTVERDGRPAICDPGIRERLAEIEGYVLSHTYSGYRQLTLAARGESAGLVGTMNKLVSTQINHRIARLALDLIDDAGLLAPRGRAYARSAREGAPGWLMQYVWSLGTAIAGGTANIQRNIIAERGLGLPRDWAAQKSG